MSADDGPSRNRFGDRELTDMSQVFEHNAWDNVKLDDEQRAEIERKIEANAREKMTQEKSEMLEEKADEFWNGFYDTHANRFFKDRNWLFTEFPMLAPPTTSTSGKMNILEVGCGTGSTVLPLLEAHKEMDTIFVNCCDFSSTAVQIVKDQEWCSADRCNPFVWDITNTDDFPESIPPGTLDAVLMIFVLSAISPDKMETAIGNMTKLLKPGGYLLFRDYARNDLAQVRFKSGKCISDNFYMRGDGTRVYFFDVDELHAMLTRNGRFLKETSYVDHRLIVNRAKGIKMYRAWLQSVYVKS